MSAAAHLRQYAKSQGLKFEDVYVEVPCPPQLEYLSNVFTQLCDARGSNGFSPNTISYSDILAWWNLYNMDPQPWEVQVLRRLDHIWFEVYSARFSRTKPQHQVEPSH